MAEVPLAHHLVSDCALRRVAYLLVDADGRIAETNWYFLAILRYNSVDECRNHPILSIVDPVWSPSTFASPGAGAPTAASSSTPSVPRTFRDRESDTRRGYFLALAKRKDGYRTLLDVCVHKTSSRPPAQLWLVCEVTRLYCGWAKTTEWGPPTFVSDFVIHRTGHCLRAGAPSDIDHRSRSVERRHASETEDSYFAGYFDAENHARHTQPTHRRDSMMSVETSTLQLRKPADVCHRTSTSAFREPVCAPLPPPPSPFLAPSAPDTTLILRVTQYGIVDSSFIHMTEPQIFQGFRARSFICAPLFYFAHPSDVGRLCRALSEMSKTLQIRFCVRWRVGNESEFEEDDGAKLEGRVEPDCLAGLSPAVYRWVEFTGTTRPRGLLSSGIATPGVTTPVSPSEYALHKEFICAVRVIPGMAAEYACPDFIPSHYSKDPILEEDAPPIETPTYGRPRETFEDPVGRFPLAMPHNMLMMKEHDLVLSAVDSRLLRLRTTGNDELPQALYAEAPLDLDPKGLLTPDPFTRASSIVELSSPQSKLDTEEKLKASRRRDGRSFSFTSVYGTDDVECRQITRCSTTGSLPIALQNAEAGGNFSDTLLHEGDHASGKMIDTSAEWAEAPDFGFDQLIRRRRSSAPPALLPSYQHGPPSPPFDLEDFDRFHFVLSVEDPSLGAQLAVARHPLPRRQLRIVWNELPPIFPPTPQRLVAYVNAAHVIAEDTLRYNYPLVKGYILEYARHVFLTSLYYLPENLVDGIPAALGLQRWLKEQHRKATRYALGDGMQDEEDAQVRRSSATRLTSPGKLIEGIDHRRHQEYFGYADSDISTLTASDDEVCSCCNLPLLFTPLQLPATSTSSSALPSDGEPSEFSPPAVPLAGGLSQRLRPRSHSVITGQIADLIDVCVDIADDCLRRFGRQGLRRYLEHFGSWRRIHGLPDESPSPRSG